MREGRGVGSFKVFQTSAVRRVLLWGLSAAILAGIVTFFIPKTYRAQTKILPAGGLGSMLPGSELLEAAGISGLIGGQLGGRDNPVLTYPEIILSTQVLERTLLSPYPPGTSNSKGNVLSTLDVNAPTQRERLYKGWRKMRDIVNVSANPKTGMIEIGVVTRDSVLSAHIANTLVLQLNRFNVETRASRGKAVREFVQGRLLDTEAALARAEANLSRFQESNLRIGNSPPLLLEQARLRRDVDIQSDLYRLLSRQYELARVEEHRDTPSFTVLEVARPPVRKYRPKILLSVLSAAFAAASLAFLYGALEERRARRLSGPERSMDATIPRDRRAAIS